MLEFGYPTIHERGLIRHSVQGNCLKVGLSESVEQKTRTFSYATSFITENYTLTVTIVFTKCVERFDVVQHCHNLTLENANFSETSYFGYLRMSVTRN
uniref:Uncharacterized protein n=1 Tax=Mesocestoides corti TaxID=53468 RepID=A0A5K3F2Q4_MESCO